MNTYFALVDKDPDSAFGIRFPDIPGCFSAADDVKDVVANATEALRFWSESMPVPEPSGYDTLIVLPDICKSLADGSYLVAVPQ